MGIESTTFDKLEQHKGEYCHKGVGESDQGREIKAKADGAVPFLYNFSPSVVPPPLDWTEWIHVTGESTITETRVIHADMNKATGSLKMQMKARQRIKSNGTLLRDCLISWTMRGVGGKRSSTCELGVHCCLLTTER